MGMLTGLATRRRRRSDTAAPSVRVVDPSPLVPATTPTTPEQLETRTRRVRLVAEDVESGERTVLGEPMPWRAVEVLGSAGLFYGSCYENRERPFNQVLLRRSWATYVGRILWDMAEERVGIQTRSDDDLPRLAE